MNKSISLPQLENQNGQHVGTSDWIDVNQTMIDEFAEVTHDKQYIHIDPIRAAKTPFGGTIAHGFLTLSLSSKMSKCLPKIENSIMTVNYGLEKLRFIAPVPSGSKIRGHFKQLKLETKSANQRLIHYELTIEIENHPKPALIAELITMIALA
ncbi:MAG: MaoC family dehydratase [Alphaproteobacteria bacterium]|nr:MaoC family dehydratase [Alphaproteobacteria bacterium]